MAAVGDVVKWPQTLSILLPKPPRACSALCRLSLVTFPFCSLQVGADTRAVQSVRALGELKERETAVLIQGTASSVGNSPD